jgi:hypothetical protein
LDQEVDLSRGLDLHRAVRHPWGVKDRDHNYVTEGPGELAEYTRRVSSFVKTLEEAGVNVAL